MEDRKRRDQFDPATGLFCEPAGHWLLRPTGITPCVEKARPLVEPGIRPFEVFNQNLARNKGLCYIFLYPVTGCASSLLAMSYLDAFWSAYSRIPDTKHHRIWCESRAYLWIRRTFIWRNLMDILEERHEDRHSCHC